MNTHDKEFGVEIAIAMSPYRGTMEVPSRCMHGNTCFAVVSVEILVRENFVFKSEHVISCSVEKIRKVTTNRLLALLRVPLGALAGSLPQSHPITHWVANVNLLFMFVD